MDQEKSMSKPLVELKREARSAAEHRGHFLMPFSKISARLHLGICRRCGSRVQIIHGATGDEQPIGGDAVSNNCA